MRWEREQPCVNDDGRCVERAGSMGATRTSPQPSHSSGTNAYVSRAVRLTAVVCLITICKAELLAVPQSHPHLPSRPPILACLWPSDVSVLLNVTQYSTPKGGPSHFPSGSPLEAPGFFRSVEVRISTTSHLQMFSKRERRMQ